uniref:Clone 992 transcribed RNA sequence n=1 Tax=Plectreurys tristis TaxID=33319 RepID=A0A0C4W9U1_PLETR|nr:hypothetical protein [Plectreurys tristis]
MKRSLMCFCFFARHSSSDYTTFKLRDVIVTCIIVITLQQLHFHSSFQSLFFKTASSLRVMILIIIITSKSVPM